jgi:homopolymeric O-antigen transport system ATP-binding protein
MNTQSIAKLEHVALSYRQQTGLPWKRSLFWAIEDISFDLRKGDTLGIIGRNGAGKSSLLRLISGIINPDRGTINRDPRTKTTLLSFGAGFEPRLTGRQNIILNGLQLGIPKEHITAQIDSIIELADIGEFINQPVRAYSTGMRARLGFAIAYFVDTDILLIDEALAAGDEHFRAKATKLIKEKIDSDLTVVIVSHSMNLIEKTCTRVIQVEHGRSLEEISPKKTIERYRNTTRSDEPTQRKLVTA